jgi:hypothetical protein
MENKFIVPRLEEHEDITKKQPQEDFTDLDAVCYYSNIPLSELCSPEQIFSLKGFPATLPAFSVTAAIPRVIDNEIVSIDTFNNISLHRDVSEVKSDIIIAKELFQREVPPSEPVYFNADCKRFDTEVDNKIVSIDTFTKTSLQNDKKVYGAYDGDIKKIKVTGVLSNETRNILRDKRKSRNRISKTSKRKNRS